MLRAGGEGEGRRFRIDLLLGINSVAPSIRATPQQCRPSDKRFLKHAFKLGYIDKIPVFPTAQDNPREWFTPDQYELLIKVTNEEIGKKVRFVPLTVHFRYLIEFMVGSAPIIVGFGGTSRAASSGELLVSAVLAHAERLGARTQLYGGMALATLPHFSPESRDRTAEQTAFVEAIRAADGIIIATPGYHGGVSGLVKNAIDRLEDLREDSRPYFDGRAVGLIVTAAGWQACGVTLMIEARRGNAACHAAGRQ